jgi:carbamoyl-phosphate synthase large subunit
MKKRILITGTGGPAGIAVMRELGDRYEIFAADLDPNAAGLYLVPQGQRFLVPAGKDPNFVRAVHDLAKKNGIDVVIPTVDSELLPLSLARAELQKDKIQLACAETETLECTLDKWRLLERCTGVAPVPSAALLDASFSLEHFERECAPRFVKPRTGSGGRGAMLVRSASDFALLPKDGTLMVQEFLPGEEFSVDVYVNRSGFVLASVPRVRMKVDSGIAVTARTVNDRALIEAANQVAKAIGLWGVANIQFRRDVSGVAKLLEVNPRFPGSLPLTAEAGPKLAQLFVREALGEVLPDELCTFREVGMVRTWQEHFLPASELLQLTKP